MTRPPKPGDSQATVEELIQSAATEGREQILMEHITGVVRGADERPAPRWQAMSAEAKAAVVSVAALWCDPSIGQPEPRSWLEPRMQNVWRDINHGERHYFQVSSGRSLGSNLADTAPLNELLMVEKGWTALRLDHVRWAPQQPIRFDEDAYADAYVYGADDVAAAVAARKAELDKHDKQLALMGHLSEKGGPVLRDAQGRYIRQTPADAAEHDKRFHWGISASTERMWWKHNGRLAHIAGDLYLTEDRPFLESYTEHHGHSKAVDDRTPAPEEEHAPRSSRVTVMTLA